MQYANQEPDEKDPSLFSAFKKAEKKYRAYNKKTTDFSQLLDLNKWDENLKSVCTKQEIIDPDTNKVYNCFEFAFPQGLFVIKDFLTIEEQITTTLRCLNEYHKKPHRTNMYIYEEPNEANKNEPLPTYDITKFLVDDPEKYYFNKKIRWTNLGYHYDWNERRYPSGKTNIPEDMRHLPLKVIKLMNYSNYFPESVIVNFYDKKNYMGGHLDDGELDQVSPIISFSIGLSCVFLIGGPTRDVEPHAIKLDSGDVMIMGGKSRGSVHGNFLVIILTV
jgi:alkylated DNA repair protein alkB homolog 1